MNVKRRSITTASLACLVLLAAVATVGAATITGTAGNDTLRGGAKADKLNGKGGNDKLYSGAGNDVLVGGAGNDLLVGGPGADKLSCGPGTASALATASSAREPGHARPVQGAPRRQLRVLRDHGRPDGDGVPLQLHPRGLQRQRLHLRDARLGIEPIPHRR
jgi:hypothetical protein